MGQLVEASVEAVFDWSTGQSGVESGWRVWQVWRVWCYPRFAAINIAAYALWTGATATFDA